MRLFPGTSLFAVTLLAVGISTNAYAVVPVIKTVRAAAADPLRPHPGYPGKTLILKATANAGGAPMSYDWDFGDGSPHVTGPVSDPYIVEATHSYGSIGSFTAILKVTNTSTAEFAIANYSIQVSAKTLATEVNIAIEDGLWYLHKTMGRSTVTGTPYGTWFQCPKGGSACAFYPAIDPQNIQAFEVVGFLESGSPQDPYTETVSRAMKAVLNGLGSSPIPNTKTLFTNPALTTTVTVNPDTNGNGLSVGPNSSQQIYQGGMFLDALVAANNPAKVVDFGPLVGGGRTYLQTIQDMVDFYANCQDEGGNDGFSSRPGGGWRYDCNGGADNSVNQWGAIGMIAAEQTPGVAHSAPAGSKLANLNGWLAYSQDTSSGIFGYDTSSSIWGPYATTPSGMVQLVWDEVGRGDTRWDKAESFIRDNFGNTGGSTTNIKAYYYGLFSFTKSMLLHTPSTGITAPITLLRSSTPGVNPIDWYGAERNISQPESVNNTNGVARTLVNEQSADGHWTRTPDQTNEQDPFDTAWAVIMLNRTVFQALPQACFTATPASVASGGPVQFDAKCSFHQDATKSIIKYEWDFTGGVAQVFTVGNAQEKRNITAPVGTAFPIKLRVTDNSNPALTAIFVSNVTISSPPIPPTAIAGGPYNFCTNRTALGLLVYAPFLVDGSRSSNPDEGQREPGAPASTIVNFAWFLDPANPNTISVQGPATKQVRVDVAPFNYQNRVGQSFNIKLRVTDNDHLAFPTSGLTVGNSSESTAPVFILAANDQRCSHCVLDLKALAKGSAPGRPGNVQLYWTDTDEAAFPIDHYNVYRSEVASFNPFLQIAGSNAPLPAIKVARLTATPAKKTLFFADNTAISGKTYFYRVTPATLNDTETCQSSLTLQVIVTPTR